MITEKWITEKLITDNVLVESTFCLRKSKIVELSPFTIDHSPIMTSTPSLIQILQQNKAQFQERYGLESLVLFGSYAKNNQQEESDVDLLYGVAPGNTMPLMRLQHLEQFISQLVQVHKIELVSKNHVEPIIELAIQKEGIVVF